MPLKRSTLKILIPNNEFLNPAKIVYDVLPDKQDWREKEEALEILFIYCY